MNPSSPAQNASELETIVVGNGWAALGAVGFLAQAGCRVCWIPGTGSRIVAPLPSLEAGPGVQAWRELAQRLGLDLGEPQGGSFVREFRNKAFREPAWAKAPTPETRQEVRDELLWEAEKQIAAAFETRFELSMAEIEEEIRNRVTALPGIRLVEVSSVTKILIEDKAATGIILSSGEEIRSSRIIFADRWSTLAAVEGLPKPLSFARGRDAMGVLQAVFSHPVPIGAQTREGFFNTLHKEAGEENQRHIWGYFFAGGMKSVWTLVLGSDEGEDNHEIAKKLRRMKQALDRMFTGTEWLPEGKSEFMANVSEEVFRFEETVLFGAGTPPETPVGIPKLQGIHFVTDGYGPSRALQQVALLLGEELGISLAEPSSEVEVSAESAQPSAPQDGVELG